MFTKSRRLKAARSSSKAREPAIVLESTRIAKTVLEEDAVRDVLSESVGKCVVASEAFLKDAAKRIDAKSFAPSLFTQREREPRRYLAKGENLPAAQTRLVTEGIERLRQQRKSSSLKVDLNDRVKNRLKLADGVANKKAIAFDDLRKALEEALAGPLTLRDEPTLTECATQRILEARFAAIGAYQTK